MKNIVFCILVFVPSALIAKASTSVPNHPDCRESGSLHPKTRASCFFNGLIEDNTSPLVVDLIREYEGEGFLTGDAGDPIELAAVFAGGHCDKGQDEFLNCNWTYLVNREFSKYPGNVGTFSQTKTLIGIVEASHDMSIQPKLIKVMTSEQFKK